MLFLLASGFSSSQANAAELKAEQANVSEISESIGNNVQNMENIQQIEQTNSTDDGDVLPEIESDLGEEETSEDDSAVSEEEEEMGAGQTVQHQPEEPDRSYSRAESSGERVRGMNGYEPAVRVGCERP